MNTRVFAKKIVSATVALCRHSALRPNERVRDAVLLDLGKDLSFRSVRMLLILFELGNRHVYLRAHSGRWSLLAARMLRWHRHATLLWRNPRSVQVPVVCSDDPAVSLRDLPGCRKLIRVCYDYGPNLSVNSEHLPLPIPMHPQLYVQYHEQERLHQYRNARRKIRLAFAGNVSAGYHDPVIGELFGKLDRFEILDFLKRARVAREVNSACELAAILDGPYQQQFLILHPELRVSQDQWLRFLSQVDFFLCPPGVLLPWSHNAVEAMAVGTIPLTNYSDLFFPNLVHHINSVTFSSCSDLRARVLEILEMSQEKIEAMRNEVVAYYDAHLCWRRFAGRLLQPDGDTVYLHMSERCEGVLRANCQPSEMSLEQRGASLSL